MVQVNPLRVCHPLFVYDFSSRGSWRRPNQLCRLKGDLLSMGMNRTSLVLTTCTVLLICGMMVPAVAAVLPVPGSIDRPGPRIGGGIGYYRIHCNVDGATVFFDGVYQGMVRLGLLLAGVYTTGTPYKTIDVKAEGYDPTWDTFLVHPPPGRSLISMSR
jgi:hypothetical protein